MSVQQAQESMVVNYVNVCAVALLVYDTLITLGDEVDFIWSQSWSPSTFFYITSKYLAFVDGGFILAVLLGSGKSSNDCFREYTVATYTLIVGMALAEVNLLLRTWAIWALSRVILVYLIVTDLALVIYGVSRLHNSLGAFRFASSSPIPTIRPCFPEFLSNKNGVFFDYVCIMFSECNVLALTLWRGYMQWRGSDNTLLNIFYRDGIIYFVSLFVITVANVILYTTQNRTMYWMLLVEPQRIAHAMLAARLVLNVRWYAEQTKSQDQFDLESRGERFHSRIGASFRAVSGIAFGTVSYEENRSLALTESTL